MGQEIESANFGRSNAAEFARRLARETDDVVRWGAEGRFVRARPQIGVEVEACLVDERFHALPINEKFLSRLADPHATIELARFNVEFNPPPIPLAGDAFDRLRAVLGDIMTRAFDVAESFDARILLAGILPTLTPGDLESRLISKSRRYRAFAAKFASWQKSRMARVEIPDNEGLVVGVNSVIMESVTTSQQIHLQIPEPGSGAYYNAAQLVAAPMVAVGANSPFFMGRDLWAESRVPVFEQVLGPRFAAGGGDDFFGRGYVEESALEIFVHNRERLPVILPELREEKKRLRSSFFAQRHHLAVESTGHFVRRRWPPDFAHRASRAAFRAHRRRHLRQRGVFRRGGAGSGRWRIGGAWRRGFGAAAAVRPRAAKLLRLRPRRLGRRSGLA